MASSTPQWKVQCTSPGNHESEEREKIMIAIQYVLAHNKGQATSKKIRDRLYDKGFQKIFVLEKTKQSPDLGYKHKSKSYSYWKANKQEYRIWTNLELY